MLEAGDEWNFERYFSCVYGSYYNINTTCKNLNSQINRPLANVESIL